MGKLIKAYAERNGITPEFNKGHKPERRAKVLCKVFGGEPGPAATLAPKLGPLGLVN